VEIGVETKFGQKNCPDRATFCPDLEQKITGWLERIWAIQIFEYLNIWIFRPKSDFGSHPLALNLAGAL
jgi:hypothetical protein